MEAVKPKKKHKKKSKASNLQSTQADEQVRNVEGSNPNSRSVEPEAQTKTESSEDACLPAGTSEGSESLVVPSTSNLSDTDKEGTTLDNTSGNTAGTGTKDRGQSSADQKKESFSSVNQADVAENVEQIQDNKDSNSATVDSTQVSTAQRENTNKNGATVNENSAVYSNAISAPVTDQNQEKFSAERDSAVLYTPDKSTRTAVLEPQRPVAVDKNIEDKSQAAVAEKSANKYGEVAPMYPKLDSLAKESVSNVVQYRPALEAFSEDHLKTFYFNPLLGQMEGFLDQFIRMSKQDDHEFYELVNAYFKGRSALALAMKEYELLAVKCDKKKDQLWITTEFEVAAQGKCADQVTVTHNHVYQYVELNPNIPKEIEEIFKKMQTALHETLALQKYTCQLARLHIDMYIHNMLSKSYLLRRVATEMLVTEQCPVDMSPEVQAELEKLRDCISVLFMFVRQPIQDNEFVEIVNAWIEQLVAVLLRVASLADLVFLLNHILRCPPGFASKIAHFIQFPLPQYKSHGHGGVHEQYFWDNPLVHHFVAMLSAVLQPVRQREEFLRKLNVGKQATMRSISWTLVDDDGESLEDEDPETSWMLIQESDLIAIFSQFPFDGIFKHLLKMDTSIANASLTESQYNVEHTKSLDVMRMLSFGSCVVYVMGNAFHTYEKVRYRGFIKRVGRTIRQVVQYVLDLWSDYRSWRVNVGGDSENSSAEPFLCDNQFSIKRLQVEVDQFFLRAAQQIISAHRLGAWQFLADMPFSSVSSSTLWKLYWALHSDVTLLQSVGSIQKEQSFRDDWREELQRRNCEFCDQLAGMNQSEAIFLLTTFANMATSRGEKNREFIEAVTLVIYQASFIASQTREMYSKTGRHLLGTVSAVHPFIISVLLESVSATLGIIGKTCKYLFTGLSINLWRPTYPNMDCVRSWLLKADLSSPEHQLARHIISNLNWGHTGEAGETDELFLHRCWHRAVAVTLVEVSALRLPNMPGGISHEAFREDSSLLKQVTMIAASSYSRIMQPGYQQELYDWLWEVMLILRLHSADLPTPVMQFTQPLTHGDELQASENVGPGFGSLVKSLSSEALDLSSEKCLTNVCHAIKAGGPLACYAAVSMTTIGSSCDLFLGMGLDHVTTIMNERCYNAVFRIVANVAPMFFGCPDKLTQEARFSSVVHRLSQLDNDNAGYAEKLLQASTAGDYCKRLAGVMHSHVQKYQAPGTVGGVSVVEFWMQTLCSLPNWHRDVCVQFLLDSLMKIAVRVEDGLAVVQTQLMSSYKTVLKESGGSHGVIASILSWVTSSSNVPPLLWDIKASPDYSYYAYSVLCNETQLEENTGFSAEMSKRLLKKPDATIDAVLKKVVKVMKLSWQPPLSNLSIYRWANQAMVTDMDHPMLPLIWQRFFSLYLQRPVTQPGLAERAGVGYRYFDSPPYLSMLKKMKQRLQATAEHHRNKSLETSADHDSLTAGDSEISKEFEHVRSFHEKLSGLFQTLALWLDEPRLHDPSLFLPSLPAPYDPARLEIVLKAEQVPWNDLLHIKKIDCEVMESVRCWVRHALGPYKKPVNSQITGQWNDRNPETAASRIIRRMKLHPPPLAPPPVRSTQAILPHLSDATLMNRQKVLNIVYTQLQGMVTQARKFCGLVNHHVSLNIEFIDLVPKMFSNETSQVVVQVPCRTKLFKDGSNCKGPAVITLKFLAKHANEVVIRKVAENRTEQEHVVQNFIQPCSSSLCEAAAYVESIITSLVNKAKDSTERKNKEILNDIGIGMFYQVSGMVDENVFKYQPTMQFFTLCIEILGKAFILHNGSQTEQLLSAILEHTSVTMLLVPYFCPNDNPDSFTSLYRRILDTDSDLVFSLLSKFDVKQWLSSPSSNFAERSALTTGVFAALNSLGYEPADKQKLILDMYLRHLSVVMMYNFPEQYSDTLRQLFEGSSKRTLCLDVWSTFLSCIGCVPGVESQATSPLSDILGEEQVLETLDWLTKYFVGQRAELGGHVTGGLYTMWRPYIKQLSFLVGFMCQQIVVRRTVVVFTNKGEGLEKVLGELWSLICSVFNPWLCSQESPIPGNAPVAPWNESEVPQACDMVTLFTDTLLCLNSHLNAPHSGTSVMNMFWTYFVSTLATEGIPDYIMRVYHSKFFLLPWASFFPTLQNLQLMQELYGLCKSGFRFLGLVFPLLDWNGIVAAYCESQTNESIASLHASLFHLLVMFSNETSAMEVQGSKMPGLLDRAQSFAWRYLDGRSFDQVVSWMVEHCNATSVLKEKSSVWYALRLIRAAAGIVVSGDGSMQPTRPDTAAKRASYVRCVGSLLCQCSSKKEYKAKLYPPVIMLVLKDIECVAGSGVDPASTASEVCMMMSEALNILNNCSPVGDLPSVILNVILQSIRDSSCTMLVLAAIPAACRTLASISFMVSVVETGIESFFARHYTADQSNVSTPENRGWDQVVPGVAVPDLAQEEFVQECIKQGALLTLYTNILQRLSFCQSHMQEMTIFTDIVTWSIRLKVRPEFEYKLVLFWHKILQLGLRQVAYGSLHALAKQLSFLAAHLHSLGEDKQSSGLFAAIGFGKKSSLSVKFRFMCRSLECFLLAQMPSNSLLRLEAKAPGYVREPKSTKQSTPGGRIISSTTEAEQALNNLDSLRSNKLYAGLTDHVMAAYSFIANPLHSLREGPQFIASLTRNLFPSENALRIVV